jgi:hypothetical protein
VTAPGGALEPLFEALRRSVDEEKLLGALRVWLAETEAVRAPEAGAARSEPAPRPAVVEKLLLEDLLDDEILGAKPSDAAFPLRLLLGELARGIQEDAAFTLACGLNLYFRATMVEEEKVRVGFEVSRLFYRMARDSKLEAELVPKVAPLLADLMNTELSKLRFESVDHVATFDSRQHEREDGAAPSNAKITCPGSFAVVVTANKMVRIKARVWT